MRETDEDLRCLQEFLDRSHAGAGEHLRSIFPPERRLSAKDLVRVLEGAFLLHLATVTRAGEPRDRERPPGHGPFPARRPSAWYTAVSKLRLSATAAAS